MQHILPGVVSEFLNGREGPGAVACSGGADSVALLLALHELKVPVTVAHVNHQLRGAESDADEAFVRDLAQRLKLPFLSTRIELPQVNLEAVARKMRYSWFVTLNLQWLATGHTADDQAETVLHRIIRGTGLQGLRGIHEDYQIPVSPPVATGGLAVIRPMLKITRAIILDYLEYKQQSFRTDSSNADAKFTRNRIRHEVMPLLKTFNPEIVSVLDRLSQQATEQEDYLHGEVERVLARMSKPAAGTMLIFDREAWSQTPPVLLREALRLAWQRQGWPLDGMTFDHWQRLAARETGDYPGRIRLTLKERVVQLGPSQ